MESPAVNGLKSQTRIAARTSLIDSIRARIDKEELKKMLLLPFSLRQAMLLLERDGSVIRAKDPASGAGRVSDPFEGDAAGEKAPKGPMVVSVNSKSGGRYGPVLKKRLQVLMGDDQVFDVSEVWTWLIDSIRGCGLSGARIDKEELKKKLLLPFSLRQAMLLLERDGSVIRAKDPASGAGRVSD